MLHDIHHQVSQNLLSDSDTETNNPDSDLSRALPTRTMYIHEITLCESKTHKIYFKLCSTQHTLSY